MEVAAVMLANRAASRVGTFPMVRDVATTALTTNILTHAANLPAFAAGDVLLLLVHGGTLTFVNPSGWTLLFTGNNANGRLTVFWKIASGSEGTTVNVSYTGANPYNIFRTIVYSIQRANTVSGSHVSANATPYFPAHSPPDSGLKYLFIASVLYQSAAAPAASSGYVGRVVVPYTAGQSETLYSMHKNKCLVGQTPPSLAFGNNYNFTAATIAVYTV